MRLIARAFWRASKARGIVLTILKMAKKAYDKMHGECVAVVLAVPIFKTHMEGWLFTIGTDYDTH